MKKYSIYKRLFVLFLVAAFTVSCMVFSASAASSDLLTSNLLVADEYWHRQNAGQWVTADEASCYFTADGSGSQVIEWSWYTVARDFVPDYIYFVMQSNSTPSSVEVAFYHSDSYRKAAFIGTYDGIYLYRVYCGRQTECIYIRSTYNSNYNGYCSILSFMGYRDVGQPIAYANIYRYWTYTTSEYGEGSWIYTDSTTAHTNATLPFSYFDFWDSGDSGKTWGHDKVLIDIQDNQRVYESCEEIRFLICGTDLDAFSLVLYEGGAITDVVPFTIEVAGSWEYTSDSMHSSITNNFVLSYWEITADLSDIDLRGKTIELSFLIEPLPTGTAGEFTYFDIIGAWITPYIEETPWYQTFWNWLSGGMSSMTKTVTDKMDSLFGDSSGGALGEAGDAMSEQSQQMNQAQDTLNSVDKPDLDTGALFGDFLTFDTGGLAILSCLTSNQYVTQFLIVVFTFALCGYVFFGKKG